MKNESESFQVVKWALFLAKSLDFFERFWTKSENQVTICGKRGIKYLQFCPKFETFVTL